MAGGNARPNLPERAESAVADEPAEPEEPEEPEEPGEPEEPDKLGEKTGLGSLLGQGGSIAAAIVTLGLLLTFLGWRSESLPWLINNEPIWIAGATLGFCLAVLLVVAGATIRRRFGTWLGHLAWVALAAGILCAVVGGVVGWSHPEYPFFTSPSFETTSDGMRVKATLKGSRLDSGDSVIFFVDTLRWLDEEQTYDVTHRRADSLGADAEGNLSETISTLIPPGDYREVGLIAWAGKRADFSSAADCYNHGKQRREISCVVLALERFDEKPQLETEWIQQDGQELLNVSITARYTESRPIFVTVTGLRSQGRRRELASFGLEPDTTGHFERTVHVSVPRRFDRVCVVARAGAGATGCPHQPRRHARADTVWQVLSRNVRAPAAAESAGQTTRR